MFDSSVVIFDCDVSARRAKCNIYSVVCMFFVLLHFCECRWSCFPTQPKPFVQMHCYALLKKLVMRVV